MKAPPITVLMAVHNGEAYLIDAVRSILRQTFGDFEFLIIDDASTDRTPELLNSLKDCRIRVITNGRNLGLTASLNIGLHQARGRWIARQDADDISHPQRLELQAQFLGAHPNTAVVGSQARLIDPRGGSLGNKDFPLRHRSIVWSHIFDNALAHSAVMFRRDVIAGLGGYDESYRVSQDYELWSRAGERHGLANLSGRLITLRIVPTSITSTHARPDLFARAQSMHVQRLFPGRRLSEDELSLIGCYRSRVTPGNLDRFRALFRELRITYEAMWPETRHSGDFRRAVAMQYERIGYNLLPGSRVDALREIGRAAAAWPPRAIALPWLRIAGLLVLGDAARSLHARLSKRPFAPRNEKT